MRNKFRLVITSASALVVAAVMGLSTNNAIAEDKAASSLEEGKELAFDRKKGNCLACHRINGKEMEGTIGPPLVAMKARFPDKAVLRAQIADPRTKNPNSIMPPFGAHGVLSDKEIDKVVEYVHSL